MDVAIILTYRCNSKCSMCNIWQNPSLPEEEVSLDLLKKLPSGFGTINLTGGEPTLRTDLAEIVDILYPKTQKLEISSNGLMPEKIEPIIRKYPNIKVRFSVEGKEETNNTIRGEKNGYQTKVNGLARLKELGGTDLGFAVVVQDDNVEDLVDLFHLAEKNGYELSTSTLHNGFQFYKNDNFPYDRFNLAHHIEKLITAQLKTNSVKNWFRAYLGLGLIARVLGNPRLLPCTVGYVASFIDPWGKVFACNVRPDLYMGDLNTQSWEEIMTSPQADEARHKVDLCDQNCWMVGSAKTAMRQSRLPMLPRWQPFWWVLTNKIKVMLGKPIDFKRYVDYSVSTKTPIVRRESWLNRTPAKTVQKKAAEHYTYLGEFTNK